MTNEPVDPVLSLATADDLFGELGRRWPDFVFGGRGVTLHDGENGFVLKSVGLTDTRVGLLNRLRMVEMWQMRRELMAAEWREEDGDDDS